MVAAAMVLAPLKENLHTCGVDLYVSPPGDGRASARSLLADVEARAAALGRTTIQCEGYVPPGETGPAEQFALARGYAVASREGFKELALATTSRVVPPSSRPSGPGRRLHRRHLRHGLPR